MKTEDGEGGEGEWSGEERRAEEVFLVVLFPFNFIFRIEAI